MTAQTYINAQILGRKQSELHDVIKALKDSAGIVKISIHGKLFDMPNATTQIDFKATKEQKERDKSLQEILLQVAYAKNELINELVEKL